MPRSRKNDPTTAATTQPDHQGQKGLTGRSNARRQLHAHTTPTSANTNASRAANSNSTSARQDPN
eukprot:5124207-Pyramimonas_sp.AAC.1